MNEILDLEIRQKIYKILLANPGLNLSAIAEQLAISVALADYHLYCLEENEIITITKEEGYKRYYIKGVIGEEDKKILSLLQQETPLKITLFFLQYRCAKPKEIREKLGVSPALLTYYLKKLLRIGVITNNPSGDKKDFILANEQRIANLLVRYKPNILLQRFKESWVTDFPLSSKVKEKK